MLTLCRGGYGGPNDHGWGPTGWGAEGRPLKSSLLVSDANSSWTEYLRIVKVRIPTSNLVISHALLTSLRRQKRW